MHKGGKKQRPNTDLLSHGESMSAQQPGQQPVDQIPEQIRHKQSAYFFLHITKRLPFTHFFIEITGNERNSMEKDPPPSVHRSLNAPPLPWRSPSLLKCRKLCYILFYHSPIHCPCALLLIFHDCPSTLSWKPLYRLQQGMRSSAHSWSVNSNTALCIINL